jgi:hypothetical protein
VLRQITLLRNHLSESEGGSDYDHVAAVFGDHWNIPNNWGLKYVKFGQEVRNPHSATTTAYIGGRVQWMQVDAE